MPLTDALSPSPLPPQVRTIAPNLPVHGSTQMTITDAPGARFAADRLGIDRVVVGRELSIDEIAAVGR